LGSPTSGREKKNAELKSFTDKAMEAENRAGTYLRHTLVGDLSNWDLNPSIIDCEPL
jgi:hypothetical protein